MRLLLLMQFVIFPLLQASADDDRTLMKYLKEKCRRNGDNTAWPDLKGVIEELPHRLSPNTSINIYHDFNPSICYDLAQPEHDYIWDLIEKLTPCLDSESKFLPHFIYDTFNYSIEGRCRNNEWMLRAANLACRTSTSDVIKLALDNCVFRLLQLEDFDFKLTANYVCGELQNVQTCMFEVANDNNCESDSFFIYIFPAFQATLTWCGKRYLELPGGSTDARFSVAAEFYFTLKCLKNGGGNAMSDLMKFADEEFPNLQDLTDPVNPEAMYTMICTDISVAFHPYLEKVMNKVDHCLDNETKFLTTFTLSTFNNTIEHLCKNGEESFVDQLEIVWNASCQAPDRRPSLFQSCAPEILPFNLNGVDYNYVLTESFFCQKLGIFIDCIVEKHVEYCSTIEMSKYVRMLLQPALEWCDGNATYLENDF